MSDPVDREYEVRLTPRADAAIEATAAYIRDEQRSPQNASAWLVRVYAAVDGLAFLPQRHGSAEENGQRSYEIRQVILDSHLVIFTVNERTGIVHVLGVRHAARRPRSRELPREQP